MGTPQFAVPVLDALAGSRWRPVLVVTQPDRPAGRGRKLTPPPVKQLATNRGIEVAQPVNPADQSFIEQVRSLQPSVVITAAYGGYLGRSIRKIPLLGCWNIHPSLLPKYRGASPVNYTLFNGDSEGGVSIFRMIARMDAGPVLLQKQISIDSEICYTELLEQLSHDSADMILEMLQQAESGEWSACNQRESDATYAPKLSREDLELHWELDSWTIHNRVRGLAMSPGVVTAFRGKPLKILKTRVVEDYTGEPGTVLELVKNEGFVVATGNSALFIELLQPSGKRVMDAWSWHLGVNIKVGEKLGPVE